MNQFNCSILIAAFVLATGSISTSAGLFPESGSDSENAAPPEAVGSQGAGLNLSARSMRELSEIEARARSARNRSDIDRLIDKNHKNQTKLIESNYINADPFIILQEEAGEVPGSEQTTPDSEFLDLKLDELQASLEAEFLADRLKEIESFEDSATVERGSDPGLLSQFRPTFLIPEPTTTAFLSIAGISFAASRYRQRRRRLLRQR